MAEAQRAQHQGRHPLRAARPLRALVRALVATGGRALAPALHAAGPSSGVVLEPPLRAMEIALRRCALRLAPPDGWTEGTEMWDLLWAQSFALCRLAAPGGWGWGAAWDEEDLSPEDGDGRTLAAALFLLRLATLAEEIRQALRPSSLVRSSPTGPARLADVLERVPDALRARPMLFPRPCSCFVRFSLAAALHELLPYLGEGSSAPLCGALCRGLARWACSPGVASELRARDPALFEVLADLREEGEEEERGRGSEGTEAETATKGRDEGPDGPPSQALPPERWGRSSLGCIRTFEAGSVRLSVVPLEHGGEGEGV